MLLDTNVLIHLVQPGGESLRDWVAGGSSATSLISRVEALGFHRIGVVESAALERIFVWLEVLPVSNEVAEIAILLRRSRRMKLGDALIAATALFYNLLLVTRNIADFRGVAGLRMLDPLAE